MYKIKIKEKNIINKFYMKIRMSYLDNNQKLLRINLKSNFSLQTLKK